MKKLKEMFANLINPYKHFGSLSTMDKFNAVLMAIIYLGVGASFIFGIGYALLK